MTGRQLVMDLELILQALTALRYVAAAGFRLYRLWLPHNTSCQSVNHICHANVARTTGW